jgi:hypothetical protein
MHDTLITKVFCHDIRGIFCTIVRSQDANFGREVVCDKFMEIFKAFKDLMFEFQQVHKGDTGEIINESDIEFITIK